MPVTIALALQRQAIINEVVRGLKRRLTPIQSFANKVSDKPVKLDGTGVVAVPYVPLEASASVDWNPVTGYVSGDGAVEARNITINRRKYQSLSNTSQDVRDQPFLLTDEIIEQKIDKLVLDVTADIASMVTLANYGAAAWTGAATGFNIGAAATLRQTAIDLNWPENRATLVVNSSYDARFIQDTAVLNAMNYGSAEVVRTGRLPQVMGFNYAGGAPVPGNGQNLVGWIALPSAGAVAMAPVVPEPAVRSQLVAYETYMDPDQSFMLTYREWGNANTDTVMRIIECAYGFAPVEGAALRRITSA